MKIYVVICYNLGQDIIRVFDSYKKAKEWLFNQYEEFYNSPETFYEPWQTPLTASQDFDRCKYIEDFGYIKENALNDDSNIKFYFEED